MAMVERMAATLVARGPDDSGTWADQRAGIALGHRRLAIIDLSPQGHQPMHSACDRYVVAFNGEIYNFSALRRELEVLGHRFRGHSDTEVMLAAISQWGVEGAVKRFNGMFAFALWDRQEKVLHLVRDRVGEKPLYYGWIGSTFVFGSELKAVCAYPDFKGEILREALALYLRYAYVPAPYSIYQGIYKLPPGCLLSVRHPEEGSARSFSPFPVLSARAGQTTPVRYWSAHRTAETGCANPFGGSERETADHLDALLRDAVKLRMVADVPLGMLLSGGIDSSTVVAFMQMVSNRQVKTFTIGFHEAGYDEAVHAKAIARHLGTDHTELYVTSQEAMAAIPRMPAIFDEPFADGSQIPTFLVSEMARRHVTVGLSGDGGDELFGGYNRYFLGPAIWRKLSWIPRPARSLAARTLRLVSPNQWDRIAGLYPSLMKNYGTHGTFGDKFHKLANVLDMPSEDHLYHRLVSFWSHPDTVLLERDNHDSQLMDEQQSPVSPEFVNRMMYWDLTSYLPDDILVKVDRASMGVSLEVRAPFLDHRLVEFAWQVPLSMKIRNRQGKWLLRQVLYKYVPRQLIDRPKAGFAVPIGSWLRGPLRDWAEALLDERRLREEAFFNPWPIRAKWMEHLSGKCNWQPHLWSILMFQSWRERWQ